MIKITAVVRKVSNFKIWGLGKFISFCNPALIQYLYAFKSNKQKRLGGPGPNRVKLNNNYIGPVLLTAIREEKKSKKKLILVIIYMDFK